MTNSDTHKPMTVELSTEKEDVNESTKQWPKMTFNDRIAAMLRSAAELHMCDVADISRISIRRSPSYEHQDRVNAGRASLNTDHTFVVQLESDVRTYLDVNDTGWTEH